jgi:hypothetical protein
MGAMTARSTAPNLAMAVDQNGVDREQIRAMLRLTPEERLRRVEEFVDGVLAIRELNEKRPIR